MRFLYASLILLSITSYKVFSQNLSSLKAAGKPEIFYSPTVGLNINSTSATLSRYWVVFSDRDGNLTYSSPKGDVVKDTLWFMERLYVAENSGDYLHLFKENRPLVWPQISKTAIDRGWIKKEKLLLWEHCLRNPSSLIDKKAMILNTFEGTTNNQLEDQVIVYKKDPDLTIDSEKKSRLFEILFVYKQTEDAVLLGENIEIQGNEIDILSNMRGWVPIESVTFWDHRITLEPNWDAAAARERKEKNIKPAIFFEERAALDYRSGNKVDSGYVVWTKDPGARRNIGQWRRFPIIEIRRSGIYHTGVMGKIQTLTGTMDPERMAEINKSIESLTNKARKINIVFVVDGTVSMGKFYAPIARGIAASVENLRTKDTKNRLSFGAVIYRDFPENEKKVELKRLTENFREVTEFFNVARTDYNWDKDLPEAVFYGLKTALTQLGLKKGESNFIILIGDCGNHERNDITQVPINEIIGLLAQYECSLISYQVNNGFDTSYQDFINQSRQLILGSAKEIRNIRATSKMKWISDNSGLDEPYFQSTGPSRYSLNPQEIVGSYLFPGIGQSLSYEILEKEISSKINEFDVRISQTLAKASLVLKGAGTGTGLTGEVDAYRPAVINFLSQIQNINDREIEIMKQRNYQFSMKGYTSKNVEGLQYPLFKETLFLSREDLAAVIHRLNMLCGYSTSNMADRRLKMQNIWIEILEEVLGSEKREEILKMSVEDLHNIIFGLPSQSEFMTKVKLKDIVEPTVITDIQFEQYVILLNQKLNSLRTIMNDQQYNESFVSNNIIYYWIPMELFP